VAAASSASVRAFSVAIRRSHARSSRDCQSITPSTTWRIPKRRATYRAASVSDFAVAMAPIARPGVIAASPPEADHSKRKLDGRCSFLFWRLYAALNRKVIAPPGPTHITRGSAVVVIGIDRRGVGCDNSPRWCLLAGLECATLLAWLKCYVQFHLEGHKEAQSRCRDRRLPAWRLDGHSARLVFPPVTDVVA
jgi:hypothetical protein